MCERYLNSKEISKVLKDIQNGKTDYIKQLLIAQPHLDWTAIRYNTSGDTILHCAARLDNIDVIRFVMEMFGSVAVDCKNKDDKTPLHEAAQFGQFETCKILLQYGADVNAIKRADWTPMMLACTKTKGSNNYKIIDLFLRHNAVVNYNNKDGWTCLHLVCREGGLNILNLFIDHGLDVFKKTKNGRTALHVAALHGHLPIIERLLSLGLDANEKDNSGNTPLHEAVLNGNLALCKYLIDRGADIKLKNNSSYGLLHLASSQGHLSVIQFLLEDLHWDVNEMNNQRLTALHCAAKNKYTDIFNFLIEKNADKDCLDVFKRKPLDYLLVQK